MRIRENTTRAIYVLIFALVSNMAIAQTADDVLDAVTESAQIDQALRDQSTHAVTDKVRASACQAIRYSHCNARPLNSPGQQGLSWPHCRRWSPPVVILDSLNVAK